MLTLLKNGVLKMNKKPDLSLALRHVIEALIKQKDRPKTPSIEMHLMMASSILSQHVDDWQTFPPEVVMAIEETIETTNLYK